MSIKRALTISAVAVGIMASNITTFADAAVAQGQPKHEGHRESAKPAARPQTQRPAVQVARPPRPHVAAPAQRHFTPPPMRHAAPAPRIHREGPRRGWGWRPWAYGAAAAGAVIVGSSIARARPSDAEACANDFDSFDWDSGTIVNEDGERQLCPYLE